MFGMNNKDGKPVDLLVVESTFIDGQLAPKGMVLEQVPSDLAMELAGAGKVRGIADADELKALKTAFKRASAAVTAPVQAEIPAA